MKKIKKILFFAMLMIIMSGCGKNSSENTIKTTNILMRFSPKTVVILSFL